MFVLKLPLLPAYIGTSIFKGAREGEEFTFIDIYLAVTTSYEPSFFTMFRHIRSCDPDTPFVKLNVKSHPPICAVSIS